MSNRRLIHLLVLTGLAIGLLACNATLPTLRPTAVSATLPATMDSFPQTQDDVPRVSPQDAKTAFDSGQAVIVDVRDAKSFAEKHIASAISIPLADIEANPTGVGLDPSKWIITYCT